jgi:hypothetical protein
LELLLLLLSQPEINYGYIGPCHLFQRSDGIFLEARSIAMIGRWR